MHENHGENTFHIECLFTVYREKFGHHPDFLPQNEEKGKRDGFNTKFVYLVDDDIPRDETQAKIEEYRSKYDSLLYEIEDDDKKWNMFPFKTNTIIFCK